MDRLELVFRVSDLRFAVAQQRRSYPGPSLGSHVLARKQARDACRLPKRPRAQLAADALDAGREHRLSFGDIRFSQVEQLVRLSKLNPQLAELSRVFDLQLAELSERSARMEIRYSGGPTV